MKVKDLNGNFAGYKVLAVEGEKVALLSDKGEAFVSTATKDTTGEIVEGVKNAVNAAVVFGEGESGMRVALDAILEGKDNEIAELTAKLEKRDNEFETVNNALKALQAQVKAQRIDAVKKAIHACLSDIKEYGNAVLTESDCADLLTDEKLAEFAEMVDAEGKFIGDIRACEIVNARCGQKMLEKSKANSTKRVFAWDSEKANSDNGATDDVAALIATFTK